MTTAQIDEATLIEQAKTQPEAFGKLYELYLERVYTYIFYRTGNHYEAEDLTAKVFHRALNHIAQYKNRGVPFSVWLFRIAHNLVVNWYRDHKRQRLVDITKLELSDPQHNPHQIAEQTNERELLQTAIRQLPTERQDLLMLKFVEKLSNVEIGQIMGKSESAIKSLYYRTLVSLKELLTEHENILRDLN